MSVPMTDGRIDFESHETWYRIEGELGGGGPAPLVTLHGGPGATHDYLLSMTDLARDGRAVIFYDQLGSGNSTHLPDRGADFWTVELFVRQLAALIEHLGIADSYHVLGQSWGGFLAQEHALMHPPGLRSLVLSNTAASFPDFVAEANRLRALLPPEVEATLRRHEADETTDTPEYEAACEVFYKRHLCRMDPWPEELVRSFALMEEDPTVYHVMNGPSEFHVIGSIRDWRATDRLGDIAAPALIISGEHDEATPALQEALVDGIATTEQVILAGASHSSHWEAREAYMAAVADWLERHD